MCIDSILLPHSNIGFPILGPPTFHTVEVFSCIYKCIYIECLYYLNTPDRGIYMYLCLYPVMLIKFRLLSGTPAIICAKLMAALFEA